MSDETSDGETELRLLMLAPTSRDASIATGIFTRAGIPSLACSNLSDLKAKLERGCGALMLAEEVLDRGGTSSLGEWLRRQPAWSDIPILVMARPGADSSILWQAVDALPNVTVIERPARVTALISTVRTALRARQRQYDLREQFARLRDSDRRKDEFLAILAHELRNPLAPIRNALTILRHNGEEVDLPRLHQMMERQVDTMVRLVDDLLEVSRITRGMIELREEEVDLGRVLRQSIETSEPLIASAGHHLEVEIPVVKVPVLGDVVRLAQVFSNLLNNAARYTPKGGRIRVSLTESGGHAVVRVQDSGVGLSAEMLPKVFDLFMQVRNNPQTAREGLGIGLTLVKNLTELHRGFVGVHSDGLGRGSSFSVHLPLSPKREATAVPSASTEASSLQGCRVVVVDDNRDAADSLCMVLATLGVACEVAYSGAAGLARIAAERPHCAIVDIGMPVMDGYEVGRRLRDDPNLGGITLIALTGWGQDVDRQRTRLAGFAHHLVKPVNLDALRHILATASAGQGHGHPA